MRPIARFSILLFAIACLKLDVTAKPANDTVVIIPLGGNAWRTDKDTLGGKITNDGIVDWSSPKATYATYIRFDHPGVFKLSLKAHVPAGISMITVTALGRTKDVILTGDQLDNGANWLVKDTGYVVFTIKGVKKTGIIYANIKSLEFQGISEDIKTRYVKNNDGDFFYWGRRGPSVHLGYTVPDWINAEWFYNEVTVPKGNDVLGSYFMACGFGEGYFGMQVNSPTERHILFSVWTRLKPTTQNQFPTIKKSTCSRRAKTCIPASLATKVRAGKAI